MKSILITGAGGFIGGFLVEEALKREKVICIVKDPRFRPPPR